MSKTVLGMIEQFGKEVEAIAGEAVRGEVMNGVDALTPKTKPGEISLWMKGAVDRMDQALDSAQRVEVMQHCGHNCAQINGAIIERARARRAKFADEEAFLAAELRKSGTSTRLERDGNLLYQYYTPRELARPVRCFCGLMRALPEGVEVSSTYCQCSQMFAQTFWQSALGRPVKVELLESVLGGAEECKFKIDLNI